MQSLMAELVNKFDRLLRENNIVFLYENKFGIKHLGRKFLSSEYSNFFINKIKFSDLRISPDDLLISLDFLKDDFSLVGCPVSEGPYRELMKLLKENIPLENSDYMRRCALGTLDWRRGFKIDIGFLKRVLVEKARMFDKGHDLIQISGIRIHVNNEQKWLIEDGKHTLALCLEYQIYDFYINEVNPILYQSEFFLKYYTKMRNKRTYSKNILFYKSILHEINKPATQGHSA